MKTEISRLTYDARRHVSGVFQQMGRVGLDADWNEWVEATLRRLAVETRDVIGHCGVPKAEPGLRVSLSAGGVPVMLSKGRLYAGGMLAELDGNTDYAQQPDWPVPPLGTWTTLFPGTPWPGLEFSTLATGASRRDLFYAEVWDRHVTALIDEAQREEAAALGSPDWNKLPLAGSPLRESALGGPDTCTRSVTVAQVKHFTTTATECETACNALHTQRPLGTSGRLQVTLPPLQTAVQPCEEPQAGGYGGTENRTYRVEIHDPGAAGTATFKWSLENGAFTLRVKATPFTPLADGAEITVTSLGPDAATKLKMDQWVELCGEETELGVWRNHLVQVAADPVVQPDDTYRVKLKFPTGVTRLVVPHAAFLRRWSDREKVVTLGASFALDTGSGLEIQFFGPVSGTAFFHEQDFWIWSAKVDTRDIEPRALRQTPQPVRGIKRHYCCLALVTWTKSSSGAVTGAPPVHCVPEFPPLTDLPLGEACCCAVITVGDGRTSHGDVDSLAEALARLPNEGGIICLKQGRHEVGAPLTIARNRVIIHGCGPLTEIAAAQGLFEMRDVREIVLHSLTIFAGGPVVVAEHVRRLQIREIDIRSKIAEPAPALAFAPALALHGSEIEVSRVRIDGGGEGSATILIGGGSGIRIVGCRLARALGPGILVAGWRPEQSRARNNRGLWVVENHFEDLAQEAILCAWYLSRKPEEGRKFFRIRFSDVAIAGNRMRGCLVGATEGERLVPPATASLADMETLAFSENHIARAATDSSSFGLLLLECRDVRIDNNLIDQSLGGSESAAWRAGIGYLEKITAGKGYEARSISMRTVITGNRVIAGRGLALLATVLNSLEVTHNLFVSEGAAKLLLSQASESDLSVAFLVQIFPLLSHGRLVEHYTRGARTHYVAAAVPSRVTPDVLPTVLFAENECYCALSGTEPGTKPLILIPFMPDVAFTNNRTYSAVENAQSSPISCGIPVAGWARVLGNRFYEDLAPYGNVSCLVTASVLTAAHNQATHCYHLRQAPGPAPVVAPNTSLDPKCK